MAVAHFGTSLTSLTRTIFDSMNNLVLSLVTSIKLGFILEIYTLALSASFLLQDEMSFKILKSTLKPTLLLTSCESPILSPLTNLLNNR